MGNLENRLTCPFNKWTAVSFFDLFSWLKYKTSFKYFLNNSWFVGKKLKYFKWEFITLTFIFEVMLFSCFVGLQFYIHKL